MMYNQNRYYKALFIIQLYSIKLYIKKQNWIISVTKAKMYIFMTDFQCWWVSL